MNDRNVVAIIQARMSSSRLPGKVLKDIAGKPMLSWVVERVRLAKLVDEVVVATTDDLSDDAVAEFCEEQGILCYRGSVYDVLDRYYQTACRFKADVIVRLTADCPLIDPEEIDHVLKDFDLHDADFAANRLPPPWKRTYPIGLDTEVASFEALERAWCEAKQKHHREHVMPYLYEESGRFKVHVVNHDPDYGYHRWTVDTAEDLVLLREIFKRLAADQSFSWRDVLALFEAEPELANINATVKHKSMQDIDERTQ